MARRKSTESVRGLHGNAKSNFVDHEGHSIPASTTYLDDHLPNDYFRQDLINLIHEMRMPGWSLVTVEMAPDLDIVKISGALTNSVYAVKAPKLVLAALKKEKQALIAQSQCHYHLRKPVSLLLRIYGLQVGFLIDRSKELETIAQLSELNIGPKLLGTFANGRFEQFLNAKPLTKEDMRCPEVSVQIARRMRELHDRVPLTKSEKERGCRCFRDLNKWIPLAEKHLALFEAKAPGITNAVMNYDHETVTDGEMDLLNQYLLRPQGSIASNRENTPSQTKRTFDDFLNAVNDYANKLKTKYANDEIVFCHNDTQYGNILRLEPPKGSPLLIPQNEYRQLVVIDFEYSGPNIRGWDIANHFCEWMSDFHDPKVPHHIWLDKYPDPAQRELFLQAYVEHGLEVFEERVIDACVNKLKSEIKDFLPLVNACWGIWGIVQMPTDAEDKLRIEEIEKNPDYEVAPNSPELDVEETDEFDYLSYASEKINLFWLHLANNPLP